MGVAQGAFYANGHRVAGCDLTINNGMFMDANNTIKALTEFKPSMSYEATEDCFVMIYIVFGSNSMIKIDNKPVANYDGNGNFGISNTFYVKAGQTISVSGASSSYNSYYIVYGIQQGTIEGKLQPIIYSTEEREVGVWTDGKPLYQKTIIKDSNFVSDANQIAHNISNVGEIISNESTLYYNNGDCVHLPAITLKSSGWTAKTRDFGDTYFYLDLGGDMLAYVASASFTLLYTKTTDTPGAGTWIPDGAYAHHYSTNEKVVGTWIDGSTIYEKTVEINSVAYDSNWHNVAHGITNIDKVISCTGILFGTDGEFFNLPQYRSTTNQGVTFGIQGSSSEYIAYINNWYNGASKIYATIRYTKSSS